MPYLANAGTLLLEVGFGLLGLLFLLRLLLQWVAAPFHNPICQFVYRLSNPVLSPLRTLLKPWWRIDLAAGFALFAVMLVKAALLLMLWGKSLAPLAVLVLALAETLELVLTLYFWLLVVHVVLSWVQSRSGHPAALLVTRLVAPALRPVRRILPVLAGLDLSPMLLILAIMLARILLVAPLQELALVLAR